MDISVIIVNVIFSLPIRQSFKYIMPDSMSPIIGGRIIVPFRSKNTVGIVISFYKIINTSTLNYKFVISLIDTTSLYTNILLDLLLWLSSYYHYPIGNIFFSILPKYLCDGHVIKKQYFQKWTITKKGKEIDLNELKKSKKQLYTLFFLNKQNVFNFELKKYNLSHSILKKLEIKKLCQSSFVSKKYVYKKYIFQMNKKLFLNKQIILIIHNILMKKCFLYFLLTKTKLYLKVKFYLGLINKFLKKGTQILIIVSCIKDISKIVHLLKQYFNSVIDIIHSKLNDTLYLKNWLRTKNGENSIVIGTNKSIFLPFFKLGLIILNQEHSLNYKIMGRCGYNIRDISILRAYKENIPIILDSDTPSLQTLHNILHKKCSYIKIGVCNTVLRFNHHIIDLQKEKIKTRLSETLINAIHITLQKKNQALLIFNKKNLLFYVLMCNICKFILRCPSCNDYFETNPYQDILYCKYCLLEINKPLFCHDCKCLSLIIHNIGIEKIKHQIQIVFPNYPLIFLNNKKNINKNIFNIKFFDFPLNTPCIIFSTEKTLENYYFPHVKLIGLICIDYYLVSLKFRLIEHLAQFYINLSTLIKSKMNSLKVIIQTSFPDHLYLKVLCNNSYFSLSNQILTLRKKFLLPPWSYQIIFYSKSVSAKNNFIFLSILRKIIHRQSQKYNSFIWCMGPNPCFLSKNIKKFVLHQLLIQFSSRSELHHLLNKSIDVIKYFSVSKLVYWFIDFDPH